jgi:hypothetical protein
VQLQSDHEGGIDPHHRAGHHEVRADVARGLHLAVALAAFLLSHLLEQHHHVLAGHDLDPAPGQPLDRPATNRVCESVQHLALDLRTLEFQHRQPLAWRLGNRWLADQGKTDRGGQEQ